MLSWTGTRGHLEICEIYSRGFQFPSSQDGSRQDGELRPYNRRRFTRNEFNVNEYPIILIENLDTLALMLGLTHLIVLHHLRY
jgi:hypothetical protein